MEFGETNSFNFLTIVIPTFNRKERLISTLSRLFCQDLSCVRNVIVIDNCSDYDVFELEKTFNNEKLKILRNPFNIGAISNVVNTFRYCETEWMWLLSDDDVVNDDAIGIIKNEISDYGDIIAYKYLDVFINREANIEDIRISSLEEFIDFYSTKGNKGELLFMSNCLYNINKLQPYMERCFNFAYTQIPHIVLLMTALNSGESVILKNKKIVTYNTPDKGSEWIPISTFLGISTITHVPFQLSEKFKKKLYALFLNDFISIVYNCLLKNYSAYNLHSIKLIYYNISRYNIKSIEKIAFRFITNPTVIFLLLSNPTLLEKLKTIYKQNVIKGS